MKRQTKVTLPDKAKLSRCKVDISSLVYTFFIVVEARAVSGLDDARTACEPSSGVKAVSGNL